MRSMSTQLDYASGSAAIRRTNWLAIAAALVALVAMAIAVLLDEIISEIGFWHRPMMHRLLLVMSVASVALAGVSLLQARRRAVPRRHAIALALCLCLIAGYWVTSPLRPVARGHPAYTRCGSNMRELGLAMIMYSNENRGQFPPSLGVLLLTEDVTWQVFVCPANSGWLDAATMEEIPAQIDARYGIFTYVYLGAGLTNNVSPDTIVMHEPLSNHGGVFNILRADARVELWPRKKMEKMLAELEAGHNPPRAELLE
jgi:hypothetical protein